MTRIKESDKKKDSSNKNKDKKVKKKEIKDSMELKSNKKFDITKLTSKDVEEELKREEYKSKYHKVLKSTIYTLIIIVSISALIATLFMPVFQISGNSMTPTFYSGDIVLSIKTNKFKTGDVIAFYHGNKILVKRVIAGTGSWVDMDEKGNVYVDGNLLDEPYLEKKVIGEYDIEFPYQVPDNQWFVLSDQRDIAVDSRNSNIGCVSKENIIGKVFLRIWPAKKV